MTYTTAQGRQQILDALAGAANDIALALACLAEAYERLDEASADRLERQLFRPVQLAYGRAQRTHGDFADRSGLASQAFESRSPGAVSQTTKDLVERAIEATRQAGQAVAELQDSMLPVEVGDARLRGDLAEIREIVGDIPAQGRELLRTLGR